MRPRKVKRGNTVYEMRAKKNGSQTPAPGQAVSLANEAPSTPSTDRLGIPLASETASQETLPATRPSRPNPLHTEMACIAPARFAHTHTPTQPGCN
jgi:hypothetical protein